MVPDADYRIKLQVFEGPLDLLLFLIRKNELDIYDIPIESVTKQYLATLRAMQQLDLEVAGEFFVMAATLMEIKSRLLLPKGQHAVDPNAEDEEVDPRWELVHQLLQYKKFKEAAAKLQELAETRQNLLARHISTLAADLVERPLKSVDRIELWNAFNIVLRRLAEKLVVGEIHDEVVTVADQMEWLLERSRAEKSFVFSALFPEGVTLRRLVATFLAMLELTRLKKLRLRQSEAFADIVAEAVEAAPPPESAPAPESAPSETLAASVAPDAPPPPADAPVATAESSGTAAAATSVSTASAANAAPAEFASSATETTAVASVPCPTEPAAIPGTAATAVAPSDATASADPSTPGADAPDANLSPGGEKPLETPSVPPTVTA